MAFPLSRFKLSPPKFIFLFLVGLVSFAGVVVYVNKYLYRTKADSPLYVVPTSIASDCSKAVDPEINAFIASVPDGSTIQFPPSGCYHTGNTIYIKDRNNLIIDGNGSTFTITVQPNYKPALPNGSKNGGNWMLLRGSNITLKNMTSIGSFPLAGQTRDLGAEGSQPGGYAEWMSNYGIYGTNGAYLQDLTGKAPWGDTVTTGPDTYVDNNTATPNYARNVFIERVHAQDTSRMCFGLTSGINMWLEDSSCSSAWYGGSDEELDNQQQPLEGLHILRNTWEGFNLFGLSVPVPGPNVKDIEIRDNVYLTEPDKPCNATIIIGAYPNNPDTLQNVAVDNNTLTHAGLAIALDHIANGSAQNNKMVQGPDPGCGTSAGPAAPITLTNSSGVTVASNGPDAPGADTSTPAPTPPGSTPTQSPVLSPTQPQTNSFCPPPTNFSGVAGPTGSGRFDFTWSDVANASSYSLYFALQPDQPSILYSGPFTSASGGAYSLNQNSQYNFAVRAICGNGVASTNSNVVAVNLNSSSLPTPTPTSTQISPTTTPPPNSTLLSLSLLLHGIGKGGDSSNTNSGGTANPQRLQRTVHVELYNSANQLAIAKNATVTFNNAQGNFTGIVDLGANFAGGIYLAKVKVDQFLKAGIPGILTITKGQTTLLPQTSLVSGDMNNDNKIDVLDYNILIDCYSDILPAKNCSDPTKKQSADITDDGAVNQFDYNLFLRELTNISGQ